MVENVDNFGYPQRPSVEVFMDPIFRPWCATLCLSLSDRLYR